MEFQSIIIENFKGIDHLKLDLKTKNRISGRNGTGKTTVADAICWLYFGKDSLFRGKFPVKSTTKTPEETRELQSSVTVIQSDGVELKKTLKEKWVKKRGSGLKVYDGDTVEYSINGDAETEKEFKRAMESIITERQFQLLAKPLFFSEVMHWQDRRKMVMEIAGISDIEIPGSKGRDLSSYRESLKLSASKASSELEDIEVRINEANKGLTLVNKEEAEQAVALMKTKIQEARQRKSEASAPGKEREAVWEEYKAAEMDWSNTCSRWVKEAAKIDELNRKEQADFDNRVRNIEQSKTFLIETNGRIQEINKAMELLRKAYLDVESGSDTCSLCCAALPKDHFLRTDIKKQLDEINQKGMKFSVEREKLETQYSECHTMAAELLKSTLVLSPYPPSGNKPERLTELEQLVSEPAESSDVIAAIDKELECLDEAKGLALIELAKANSDEGIIERVKNLKAKEKEYAKLYEEADKKLKDMDALVLKKIVESESTIKEKFGVDFKMFSENKNGNITETCEVMLNGVPFSLGCSNGEKIKTGIKIIESLQRHFAKVLPLVVDNAESVTDLDYSAGQLIELAVCEDQAELKLEARD